MRTLLMLPLLLVLAFAVDADAARVAPKNAGKVLPKIGGIAPGGAAAALAQALVGPGVTVSNARFTGDPAASGTFTGAAAEFSIASGVILSTGNVVDAHGPNEGDGWSTDHNRPGDNDLSQIVGAETFDAAVLEFDVVPVANTMSIRFVFASEEYPEFVDSDFNDVLAIFVNGVNCANYNGRPVAINSINENVNQALFIPNYTGARNTEFDGFTVPLDCVAAVTPGVPNRVKIAIADTSDGIYDAAVFIAAGGMRSPGTGAVTGSNVVRVIEYYHAVFDHYFMTAIADEITKLDNGTFAGWARTGHSFNVFVLGHAGYRGRVQVLQHGVRSQELALLYALRWRVRDRQAKPELAIRGRGVRRDPPEDGRDLRRGPAAGLSRLQPRHGRRPQPPPGHGPVRSSRRCFCRGGRPRGQAPA